MAKLSQSEQAFINTVTTAAETSGLSDAVIRKLLDRVIVDFESVSEDEDAE